MGRVAAELADLAIFTAEGPAPRKDLACIIAEMESGAREAGAQPRRGYLIEADRGQAISQAIGLARAGDTVLICGKGHEQSMCFGREEHPWDDRRAARQAAARAGTQAGLRPNVGWRLILESDLVSTVLLL